MKLLKFIIQLFTKRNENSNSAIKGFKRWNDTYKNIGYLREDSNSYNRRWYY